MNIAKILFMISALMIQQVSLAETVFNPASSSYNSNDIDASKSHIYPFFDENFNRKQVGNDVITGSWKKSNLYSKYHIRGDAYSQDWNWGSQTSDDFDLPIAAPFSGRVIRVVDCFSLIDQPTRSSRPFYTNNCGRIRTNYGNEVIIQSEEDDRFFIRLSHLNTVNVNVGDIVFQGQNVGTLGASTHLEEGVDSHLHVSMYKENALKNKKLYQDLVDGYYFGSKRFIKSGKLYRAAFDIEADKWVEIMNIYPRTNSQDIKHINNLSTTPKYSDYLFIMDYKEESDALKDFDLVVSSKKETLPPTRKLKSNSYCSPFADDGIPESCYIKSNGNTMKKYVHIANEKATNDKVNLKYYFKKS